MKAVGIIAEYNPFHNGHAYHIQKAKELTNADLAVVVMSGNFVQRGEPAILDKWERTKLALAAGADLVVELPVFYAVQPGHLFAAGAIQILQALGVKDLVFGSEHPEVDFLDLAKQALTIESEGQFTDRTQTYASAYAQQLEEQTGFKMEDPNDILAFSYAKAVVASGQEMQLHPIGRLEASYHDQTFEEGQTIASASSIRLALHKGKFEKIKPVVSDQAFEALSTKPTALAFEKPFFELLRYRLLTDTVGQLGQVYQMAEGLEHRLAGVAAAVEGPQSYQSFIKSVKTKRYTFARIQRTLLYTLLNIKVDQMQAAMADSYIRLLGFNDLGQAYLSEVKRTVTLPIISRVDMSLAKANLRLDYKAGQMWQILAGQTHAKQGQDVGRKPIYQGQE
ncbi:nucleotidyltransferase [Fructobacillus tropaeoli]|uniref:tRNA(Met) cytidine acetate ligase n=1 Tax=Fructobacillus tropaeoli TaxID=709323 RepID=A0A3F3HA56_9LACO|nr:nucleotidyltransferase [Fructobacillus tropaeoli]GAP04568.1 nucleotidyltransferase [Fructobacillus tropaeoli]GIC70694.1 nucleotidyltransferase [Fructobacillus tropaeoli]CAK1239287.1 tRNA-Met C34-N4-acetylcytidine synthase TmcAL (TmcAL) [Fructobacillus tropaeoli]